MVYDKSGWCCIKRDDRFYHFHGTDSGAERRTAGCVSGTLECSDSEGDTDLHYRKYSADSVYPSVDPNHFGMDEEGEMVSFPCLVAGTEGHEQEGSD